ncbi:MAG: right-handed parallel beta-helix repeat-containing protein [Woeseiaceae bacterium]|nr:right-handed parallel beta-helix repeat-containing protein [Woeseiaceae bacterium]
MVSEKAVLILTALLAAETVAYDLGIGIPAPSFGLEQQYAVSDLEGATRYFVDNQHPEASDWLNRYGSPERPRQTLPNDTLKPGSVMTIMGGPYEGGPVRWRVEGTIDAPIWIRGESETEMPKIRQQIVLDGQFAIVENLHFDRSRKSIEIDSGSRHIAIRSSLFTGRGESDGHTSALSVWGVADEQTSHVVFVDNEIRDFGDIRPGSRENDYHGVKASRYCSDVWILRNKIFNMGGDSVQIGDARLADGQRCSRIYISRNEFFNNRENAVDIKRANNVVVSENLIYNFAPPVSEEATAIVVHDGAASVWILANDIRTSGIGFTNSFGTDTWVIGNRFSGIQPVYDEDLTSHYGTGVGVHYRGDSTGGILLNVFSGVSRGVQLAGGSEYVISGNLFERNASQPGYDIMIKSTWMHEDTSIFSNLYQAFSARVSSSEYSSPRQLVGRRNSSRESERRLQHLVNETICRNAPIMLDKDLIPGLEQALLTFEQRIGVRLGGNSLTVPTGDDDRPFVCGEI